MNTFERPKKITNIYRHAFNCVDINLSNALATIIPSTLLFGITLGSLWANDVIVAILFIRVDLGSSQSVFVTMGSEGLLVRVTYHSPAH